MDPFEWVCSNCGKVCQRQVDRSRHERTCRVRAVSHFSSLDQGENDRRMPFTSAPAITMTGEGCSDNEADDDEGIENVLYPFHTSSNSDQAVQEDSETSSSEDDELGDTDIERGIDFTERDIGVSDDSILPCAAEQIDLGRLKESMMVTMLQKKAAFYILSSGASQQGLSIKNTQAYLESLEEDGEVCGLWKSGLSFWKDHDRRQRICLPLFGRWCKRQLPPSRPDMPTYSAYIRELPQTIVHVIESTHHILTDSNFDDTSLTPSIKHDKERRRIVSDFFSSNDMIYVTEALKLRPQSAHPQPFIVPLQLFIDKANVTRLNKRSMYPVVMYILCFSRSIRRIVAVNVAFVPIVNNLSSTGRRLSAHVAKSARCATIQHCLDLLLDPIQQHTRLTAIFPDGKKRSFVPFLLSVVADIPEVAVLLSSRYGLKTAFPCPRCYMPLSEVLKDAFPGKEIASKPAPRTSRGTKDIYASVSALRTKKEQEFYLKRLSLRLPCSSFLYRWEFLMDTPDIQETMRLGNRLPERSEQFGLASLMRFEALHNFDLGLTADILRAIHHYFSVYLSPNLATEIVDTANSHQMLLPRRSSSGFYRLPAPGTIIAESHANVTALNYRSSLCILPFILNGSCRGLSHPKSEEAQYILLQFVLCYLDVHHYTRRINTVPWYTYDTLDHDFEELLSKFLAAYKSSIGRTKGRNPSQGPADTGKSIATLKAHQLLSHLKDDIRSGGFVGGFDAQAGESHHIQTRAHFHRTSKRNDAEEAVSKRSTVRETGVLETMYPVDRLRDHATDISIRNSIADRRSGTGSSAVEERPLEADSALRNNTDGTESNGDDESEEPSEEEFSGEVTARRVRGTVMKLSESCLDGMMPDEFLSLLIELETPDEYVYHAKVDRINVFQGVRIAARIPWASDSSYDAQARKDINELLSGTDQRLHASRRFYTEEPHYDFIEFREGNFNRFGQIRLLFKDHYSSHSPEGLPLLTALVRILVDDLGDSTLSQSQDTEWKRKRRDLLKAHGCRSLKWGLTLDRKHQHKLVRVQNINRLIYVVPDFDFPVGIEEGTRRWHQTVQIDVDRDKKRFEREKKQREKRIQSSLRRGSSVIDVAPVHPARTPADGPLLIPNKAEERFIYNRYMPWTSPNY